MASNNSGAKRSRSMPPPQSSQEEEEPQMIIICGGCSLNLCRSTTTYASLRCGHNMCFECFGLAQAKRSANLKIKCPYYRTSNDNCSCETDTWDIHNVGDNVVSQTILQPKEYDAVAAFTNYVVSFGDLEVGVLANIYGFLDIEDIMRSRRINKKSREAVKMTIVPPTDECCWVVHSSDSYNDMRVMTRALPNLQYIKLCTLSDYEDDDGDYDYGTIELEHKYSDGEDPDEEEAVRSANSTSHDIEIISSFRKLRILAIENAKSLFNKKTPSDLNGRYPVLFNFPLLQNLRISCCNHLKWDLEMLAGLPLLKQLGSFENPHLTGNISSLRVLKDTLEKVEIYDSPCVEGNFMSLADFPRLKEIDLVKTAVTGDIRDIGENDFSSLEVVQLPEGVYGGEGYKLQRISEGPDIVRAVYLLKKQRPPLKMEDWCAKLSEDSPDWYEPVDEDQPQTSLRECVLPFEITLVEAGSRVGYRWQTPYGIPCEVNWLDPEPDRGSSDYEKYVEKLEEIESELDFYRGFHQPPTEEGYLALFEERREM